MTIFEFVEELCDVIAGEDGYYNYSKEELIQLCKEMSTSAQEWNDLQEIKDAQEAHELFNPNPLTAWPLTKLEKES